MLYQKKFQKVIQQAANSTTVTWDESDAGFQKFLLDELKKNHLLPLLNYWLEQNVLTQTCPSSVKQALKLEVARETFLIDIRKHALIKLGLEFKKNNIPFLVLKGAALSYTIYPRPGLRAHGDIDLFISEKNRQLAFQVFKSLGYRQENMTYGQQAGHQCAFSKLEHHGYNLVFDLHWKLSNINYFANLISFDEAYSAAQDLPEHNGVIKVMNDHHALLYAFIHGVAHHHDEENPLWLYDTHLLTDKKNSIWLTDFQNLAKEKKVWFLCAKGMEKTKEWFNTIWPETFLQEIISAKPNSDEADSIVFLSPKRSLLSDFVCDLESLSLPNKLKYLQERLIPPKEYMKKKYNIKSNIYLPALYIWRAIYGLRKLKGKP
ncbi:MAG: nucleotidyltransferase family protein [Oligoflexia bacterium]|nr:nucleotidyltransferase family protein [Oligoflexia bacterium]